jgi:hypothetical protein
MSARERQETYNKIMRASESDQTTFHRLIRNQSDHQWSAPSAKIDFSGIAGEDPNTPPVDNWAAYFQQLATPKESDTFCRDHKASADLQRRLIRANLRHDNNEAEHTETASIQKHFKLLKNGKASDALGISAEHVQLAALLLLML